MEASNDRQERSEGADADQCLSSHFALTIQKISPKGMGRQRLHIQRLSAALLQNRQRIMRSSALNSVGVFPSSADFIALA
jgi:hypothetical protein